jgi:hypothetical protein
MEERLKRKSVAEEKELLSLLSELITQISG